MKQESTIIINIYLTSTQNVLSYLFDLAFLNFQRLAGMKQEVRKHVTLCYIIIGCKGLEAEKTFSPNSPSGKSHNTW